VPLQVTSDSQAAGLPFSFTAPDSLTSGSVQLLLIGIYDEAVTSVTDSLGETWIQDDEVAAYSAAGYVYVYRCDTTAPGSAPTVTVHGASSAGWSYCYVEDTLMAQGGPLTVSDDGSQGSGAISVTTAAVGTSGNIGVGFCAAFQADVAATAGETLPIAQPSVTFVDGGSGIVYQSATVDSTTFTAGFTLDNFCNWGAVAIVYAPGGGGGGGGAVSGQGSISVSSPSYLEVAIVSLTGFEAQSLGNPTRYWGLGSISWGKSGYNTRNYYIEHQNEVVAAFPDADTLYYSFAPGISATLTLI
jgi:hypothetical protein